MTRARILPILPLASVLLVTACSTTPAPTATTFEPSAADVQAIQTQLTFTADRLLTLKDTAAAALSPDQLTFAQRGLEVSNYMVSSGRLTYSAVPDGTLIDPNATIDQQGICDNKIDHVNWINRSGVWSASNHPTGCGAWIGNHFNSWDAWLESVRQTPNSSQWSKTYGTSRYWSMYNQFQCHFLVVRGTKTPWNLEPTRPDVGYARTVAAGCNPGGGSD